MTIKYNAKDLKRFSQVFNAIFNFASAQDVSDLLDQIGAYQQRQLAKAFDASKDPATGTSWPPLAPSTKQQKRNPKILVETIGRIPSSLFYEVNKKSVVIGYGDPLALVHHNGAQTKPRVIRPRKARALYWSGARYPVKKVNHPGSVIPARPLIGASAADQQEWVSIGEMEAQRIWNLF